MRLEIFLRDATPFYAMQTNWRNNPVLFGSWISYCVEDILAAFNLAYLTIMKGQGHRLSYSTGLHTYNSRSLMKFLQKCKHYCIHNVTIHMLFLIIHLQFNLKLRVKCEFFYDIFRCRVSYILIIKICNYDYGISVMAAQS